MSMQPVRPNPFWLAVAALPSAVVRLTVRVLFALLALFCILLLVTRFVIFPQIENYRGRISAMLQQQIGEPVELGALAGAWDGWNPRLDIENLLVVDGKTGRPLLILPAVHLTVAWTSLLFIDLRFKEAVLDRPHLDVWRDAQGILRVAGLTVEPGQGDSDTAPADWLLRQRRILIHDGTVTWRDETRDAPPLELTRVEFRMENHFGRHRFGLTGAPPAAIAAPIDLRGDVTGHSLADWRASSGRLYARLDYADAAAWQQWLPLPLAIKSGQGAVRVWLEYANGEVRAGVADLVLVDVRATLAPELQELTLDRLDGRVGWRSDGSEREVFAEHLGFSGAGGTRFDPTDFKLVLRAASGARPNTGQMELSNLQLGPLRQVAAGLPLPERWRQELSRYNPRGTLAQGHLQWQGDPTAPKSFVASTRFSDLGIDAQDGLPGVNGLSGTFESTEQGGALVLLSRSLVVDLPGVFAERLALDSVKGRIGWERKDAAVAVTLSGFSFANAQGAGTASGTYQTAASGPGTIDLTVLLPRADVRDVYRYVPVTVPESVRTWLRRGLASGSASDIRLRLAGDLADFPFADGKKGQFLVTAKAQGVTLDYADHWPALTDIDGDVRFEGARMTIDAQKGRFAEAAISPTKAEIANLRAPNPLLTVTAAASGPTASFLRFVAESPIAEWTEHFTDGAEATGAGKLALKLELPLGKPADDHVAGEFTFGGNRVKLADGLPVLNHLNGTLAFSGHQVQDSQLTADLLGGAARFTIASDVEHLRVTGKGNADTAQLRVEYPQLPLVKRVTGNTDWQLAIVAGHDVTTWTLDSNLGGVTIDLPKPMTKAAAETVPLQFERHSGPGEHETIVARYGHVGQLTLERRRSASGAPALNGLLALGGVSGEADRPGLWVRGRLDTLNADGWLVVKHEIETPEASDELPLAGVDVNVHELDLFGRSFNDLRIDASRSPDAWQIAVNGRELAGTARWQGAAAGRPNGRINAHLQRLTVPQTAADAVPIKPEPAAAANPWPEIDIVSDSFLLHDRDLGKLELTAQPLGADWQIQRVQLVNDDGKLSAEGWWRVAGRTEQTNLDAELNVTDAGRYLARFGLPGAVTGAASKVKGQISWAGGPQAFDYPTLTGNFSIQSGPGQFIKVDPGAGKLLGVLSLQSLARRLALDFRDLVGEGFAFDDITGDVRIQNGVMRSDNLSIIGPAARVAISGEADIAHETQQLKVRVQPTLSATLSTGAALLMIANPLIGAAVGAGSWALQKVFQDPFEQMFSFEYVISGSWSNPRVERTGHQATTVLGPTAPVEPSPQ
jgi:uncharacterized protein (TIGR02099 family)